VGSRGQKSVREQVFRRNKLRKINIFVSAGQSEVKRYQASERINFDMKGRKVSIVTPSFNQGAFIEEAIESVIAQGYLDFEHIIVDNCSTDGTSKILACYPHLKVICEKDRGQSDALNKGFKAATGDIIGWLNADDKYLSGCFDRMFEVLAKHSEFDIVYGDYRFIDTKGDLIRVRKELGVDGFMSKYVLYIPTTTMFFRRRIFDQGHFLDINYHYAMDYEFFLRLAGHGFRFGHIPRIMADFRWHNDSKSSCHPECQYEEMKKALVAQDKLIGSLQEPQRTWALKLFMAMARVKRCFLKLFRGAYW
jgi:glycosyltransferase involved in cell wall biosynthesis